MKKWLQDMPIIKKMTLVYLLAIFVPSLVFGGVWLNRSIQEYCNNKIAGNRALLQTVVQNVSSNGAMVENAMKILAKNQTIIKLLSGGQSQVQRIITQQNEVIKEIGNVQAYLAGLNAEITLYALDEQVPVSWWKTMPVAALENSPSFKSFTALDKDFAWVGIDLMRPLYPSFMPTYNSEKFLCYITIVQGISRELGYLKCGVETGKLLSPVDEWNGDGVVFIEKNGALIYESQAQAYGAFTVKDNRLTLNENMMYVKEHSSALDMTFYVAMNRSFVYEQALKHGFPLFIVLLAVGVFLFISIKVIVGLVLGRLKQAVAYTKQAEEGEMNIAFPEGGKDEIGQLINSFNILLNQLQNNAKEKIQQEKAEKKALLMALQYQINPHFLFNTLNWLQISMEMGVSKNITANATLLLSQLLRYNLSGEPQASLREEVDNMYNYIELMNMRKNNRIFLEVDTSGLDKQMEVMRFMFQPIIENAVHHGMRGKNHLHIKVTGYEKGDNIHFTITNNGWPISPQRLAELKEDMEKAKSGTGIGIANIFARLKLLYGPKSKLLVSSTDETTSITIIYQKR